MCHAKSSCPPLRSSADFGAQSDPSNQVPSGGQAHPNAAVPGAKPGQPLLDAEARNAERRAKRKAKRDAAAALAAPAPAGDPLPPPGSYYEYAGQRVLVPEWPKAYTKNNRVVSPNLVAVIKQALTSEAPVGKPNLQSAKVDGLTEWGKEVVLRVRAKVAALKDSRPTTYTEVRACTCKCFAHKVLSLIRICHTLSPIPSTH